MLKIFLKRYRKGHSFAQMQFLYLLIFLLANIDAVTYAQHLSSNIVNGFGSTITEQNSTFDSSLGELAVSTITAGGYAITQGFLQPIDLKIPCGDVALLAFPNPVLSEMTIFAEGCDIEVAAVKTYDLFGKLVYEGNPVNNKINFSTIGVGVYLVRAYNNDNQVVGVVKILKSTI